MRAVSNSQEYKFGRGRSIRAYDEWCSENRIPDQDRVSARAVSERMKRTYKATEGRHVTCCGIGLKEEAS